MGKLLQRIVKNEAMKQDPPEIYGWRAFVLALSACFGGMLFGMDIGTIGRRSAHFTSFQNAKITALTT
ncbi:hypothetical protein KC334_g15113, partial [Hortaea werneckii]